jgi:2-haloacid dehalogenase
MKTYPEIDRVEWFTPEEARRRVKEAQAPLLDRLDAALANGPGDPPTPGDGEGQQYDPATTSTRLRAVVFDLGAVLIDWNPRHLYRTLFGGDEAAMEHFLSEVCNPEWNVRIDAGRPFAEAVEELASRHPDRAHLIHAYRERWGEMLGGVLEGTLAVVRELRGAGVPVYALSNWSAETFALTRSRFPFLDELEGIVISGDVGVGKPDPAIFRHFMARFGLQADEIAFVDDSPANVAAARGLGIEAIRFENAEQVRRDLRRLGFPLAEGGDALRD